MTDNFPEPNEFPRYSKEFHTLDINVKLWFETEEAKDMLIARLTKMPIKTWISIFNQAVPDPGDGTVPVPQTMPCIPFEEVDGTAWQSENMSEIKDIMEMVNKGPTSVVTLRASTYKKDMIDGDFLKKGEDYDVEGVDNDIDPVSVPE